MPFNSWCRQVRVLHGQDVLQERPGATPAAVLVLFWGGPVPPNVSNAVQARDPKTT